MYQIEEERRIAEENDIKFTLMTLDALSPDPDASQEIARYAKNADRKVYVHDFLDDERFEALKKNLNWQIQGGADEAATDGG